MAQFTFPAPTQVKNLLDPSVATDAATKAYVDANGGKVSILTITGFTFQSIDAAGTITFSTADTLVNLQDAQSNFPVGSTMRVVTTDGNTRDFIVASITQPTPNVPTFTATFTVPDPTVLITVGSLLRRFQPNQSQVTFGGGFEAQAAGGIFINTDEQTTFVNQSDELEAVAIRSVNGVASSLTFDPTTGVPVVNTSINLISSNNTVTFTPNNTAKTIDLRATGGGSSAGTATARNTAPINQALLTNSAANQQVTNVQIGTGTAYSDTQNILGTDSIDSTTQGRNGYTFSLNGNTTVEYNSTGATIIRAQVSGSTDIARASDLFGGFAAPRFMRRAGTYTNTNSQFPGLINAAQGVTQAVLKPLGQATPAAKGFTFWLSVFYGNQQSENPQVFANGLPYISNEAGMPIRFFQCTQDNNPSSAVTGAGRVAINAPASTGGFWRTSIQCTQALGDFYAACIRQLVANGTPALPITSSSAVGTTYYQITTQTPSFTPDMTPTQYGNAFVANNVDPNEAIIQIYGSNWTNGAPYTVANQATVRVSTAGSVTDSNTQTGFGLGLTIAAISQVFAFGSGDYFNVAFNPPSSGYILSGKAGDVMWAPQVNFTGANLTPVNTTGYWILDTDLTYNAQDNQFKANIRAGSIPPGSQPSGVNTTARILRNLTLPVTVLPFGTAGTTAGGVIEVVFPSTTWVRSTLDSDLYPNGSPPTPAPPPPSGQNSDYQMTWVFTTPPGNTLNHNQVQVLPQYASWDNHVTHVYGAGSTPGITPTLQQVLVAGNSTGGSDIVLTQNSTRTDAVIASSIGQFNVADGSAGQVPTKPVAGGNALGWTYPTTLTGVVIDGLTNVTAQVAGATQLTITSSTFTQAQLISAINTSQLGITLTPSGTAQVYSIVANSAQAAGNTSVRVDITPALTGSLASGTVLTASTVPASGYTTSMSPEFSVQRVSTGQLATRLAQQNAFTGQALTWSNTAGRYTPAYTVTAVNKQLTNVTVQALVSTNQISVQSPGMTGAQLVTYYSNPVNQSIWIGSNSNGGYTVSSPVAAGNFATLTLTPNVAATVQVGQPVYRVSQTASGSGFALTGDLAMGQPINGVASLGLAQNGATDGQVLAWNDLNKQFYPTPNGVLIDDGYTVQAVVTQSVTASATVVLTPLNGMTQAAFVTYLQGIPSISTNASITTTFAISSPQASGTTDVQVNVSPNITAPVGQKIYIQAQNINPVRTTSLLLSDELSLVTQAGTPELRLAQQNATDDNYLVWSDNLQKYIPQPFRETLATVLINGDTTGPNPIIFNDNVFSFAQFNLLNQLRINDGNPGQYISRGGNRINTFTPPERLVGNSDIRFRINKTTRIGEVSFAINSLTTNPQLWTTACQGRFGITQTNAGNTTYLGSMPLNAFVASGGPPPQVARALSNNNLVDQANYDYFYSIRTSETSFDFDVLISSSTTTRTFGVGAAQTGNLVWVTPAGSGIPFLSFIAQFTTTPTLVTTITTGTTGSIYSWTTPFAGQTTAGQIVNPTIYRFVPTPYATSGDQIYNSYDSGTQTLSGLLATRSVA